MRSVSKVKSASPAARTGLHDATGHSLYLTAAERTAFLVAAQHCPREVRTLCVILGTVPIKSCSLGFLWQLAPSGSPSAGGWGKRASRHQKYSFWDAEV